MPPIYAVILVVDDDPKVKASLAVALSEYQLLTVSSGEKALEILREPHEIDLVILDVKMQGMSGIDLLPQIKSIQPRLPVIVLTGYGSRDVVIGALQGRADDFLDKPFNAVELRRRIQKLVEPRRHEKTRGEDSIDRIQQFVRRNFQRGPTLSQAAKVASLSPKYLSRKFKSKVKKSFTRFRIDLRMDQAKQLLVTTSFNVNEISDRIGYENPESFMKMFKKILGCTPSQYRAGKGS